MHTLSEYTVEESFVSSWVISCDWADTTFSVTVYAEPTSTRPIRMMIDANSADAALVIAAEHCANIAPGVFDDLLEADYIQTEHGKLRSDCVLLQRIPF